MRRISALVVVACLLGGLTACSGGTGSSDCGDPLASGDASTLVEATGDFDTAPTVTFPQPLITTSIEKSVLIEGDGAVVRDGQPVILEASILSGADGSVINQTDYTAGGGSIFTVGDPGLPALGAGLECSTVGSRIAIVASGAENAAEGAATSPDTIVYVVDVLSAYPSRAEGTNQLPKAGLPSVVTAPDGTPGITIPNDDAPTEYEASTLIEGRGSEIEDDDVVIAKYTAVDWTTGTVIESGWSDASINVIALNGTEVGDGLREAVVGQKIGSQVIAVIPPELSGPDGTSTSQDTAVYVIDILGTIN